MNLARKQKPLTDEAGSGSKSTKERRRNSLSVLDAVFHFASRIGIHMTRLDPIGIHRHHAGVTVNPVAGRENPIYSLRISRRAAFAALVRPFQWAGLGRASFGWAGTGVPVSHPYPCARPTRVRTGGGMLNITPESTMQTLITRALSRLFLTRRLAFSLYHRRTISALTLVRMIGGAA